MVCWLNDLTRADVGEEITWVKGPDVLSSRLAWWVVLPLTRPSLGEFERCAAARAALRVTVRLDSAVETSREGI